MPRSTITYLKGGNKKFISAFRKLLKNVNKHKKPVKNKDIGYFCVEIQNN